MTYEDKGKGIINHDAITFYEDEKQFGIHFKNGIDPEILLNQIEDAYKDL